MEEKLDMSRLPALSDGGLQEQPTTTHLRCLWWDAKAALLNAACATEKQALEAQLVRIEHDILTTLKDSGVSKCSA